MKTTKTKAAAKTPAKKAAAGKAAKVDPKAAKGAAPAKGKKRA